MPLLTDHKPALYRPNMRGITVENAKQQAANGHAVNRLITTRAMVRAAGKAAMLCERWIDKMIAVQAKGDEVPARDLASICKALESAQCRIAFWRRVPGPGNEKPITKERKTRQGRRSAISQVEPPKPQPVASPAPEPATTTVNAS